jgi:hypothetical protein
MDRAYTVAELERATMKRLRALCIRLGVPYSEDRSILVKRILAHQRGR